jgi:DNA repair exonuclease SbcCD ATPase subunit
MQAFRAFQERQSSPELPSTGLVGLRGHNKDTGGSSGAGKSSVAYAIAYAFGFLPFSATSQQNWHTEAPMQVELELDTPEGSAVLKVGKENSLVWNGQTYKGSAKVVKDGIRKMWGGVDPELVKALVFKQQRTPLKKPDRFLSMKDSERKEFLSMLLGLGEIEEHIDDATKRANSLLTEAQKLEAVVKALENQIQEPVKPDVEDTGLLLNEAQELRERVDDLKNLHVIRVTALEREKSILARERRGLMAKLAPLPSDDNAKVEALLKIGDLKAKLQECDVRVDKAILTEKEDKSQLLKVANDIQAEWYALAEVAAKKGVAERAMASYQKNLKDLLDSRCERCGQGIDSDSVQKFTSENEVAYGKAKLAYEKAALAEEQAPELRAKYVQAFADANEYRSYNVTMLQSIRSKVMEELAAEKAKLEAAQSLEVAEREKAQALRMADFEREKAQALRTHEEAVHEADTALKLAQGQLQGMEARILASRAARKLYENAMVGYEATALRLKVQKMEHESTLKKAHEEADFAAMMKGFLGAIFDEVLTEISVETNEILKGIPNTPTTTVAFVSEVLTAKGSLRQEIRPIVTKNGAVIDLESGVSGGQMESVELAVDLSIAKVIGDRTGVRPGFMIFDESFSAHCLPVKQACLAVLAHAATDAMIMVVDHATELREGFSAFIDVESERDVSRFK